MQADGGFVSSVVILLGYLSSLSLSFSYVHILTFFIGYLDFCYSELYKLYKLYNNKESPTNGCAGVGFVTFSSSTLGGFEENLALLLDWNLAPQMNYRIELLEGINSWTREEYRDACGSLIRGLELITKLSPSTFFLAGVTPGTNLLGTICEGLNEGDMLWKRLHHVFSKQAFPLGSFHVGWMTSL